MSLLIRELYATGFCGSEPLKNAQGSPGRRDKKPQPASSQGPLIVGGRLAASWNKAAAPRFSQQRDQSHMKSTRLPEVRC